MCLENKKNNPCSEKPHLSRGHSEPLEDDAWCPWETELSQLLSWLLLPLSPLGHSLSQTWYAAAAKLHSSLPLSTISCAETSNKAELCVSFELEKNPLMETRGWILSSFPLVN